MAGEALAAGFGDRIGAGWRSGWSTCLDAGNIGVEIFQAEGQLIVIDLFGASAKLRSLQPRNDEPESADLGLRPRKLGTLSGHLRGQVTHQGVQRTDIDWQRGEIEVHAARLMPSRSNTQRDHRRESISRKLQAHPATAGRHLRSGAHQSMPSIDGLC